MIKQTSSVNFPEKANFVIFFDREIPIVQKGKTHQLKIISD